jgi:hypothetical protein
MALYCEGENIRRKSFKQASDWLLHTLAGASAGKCGQLHNEELQNLYPSQFHSNLMLSTPLCSVDKQTLLTITVGTSIIKNSKILEKYCIEDIIILNISGIIILNISGIILIKILL